MVETIAVSLIRDAQAPHIQRKTCNFLSKHQQRENMGQLMRRDREKEGRQEDQAAAIIETDCKENCRKTKAQLFTTHFIPSPFHQYKHFLLPL